MPKIGKTVLKKKYTWSGRCPNPTVSSWEKTRREEELPNVVLKYEKLLTNSKVLLQRNVIVVSGNKKLGND